MDSVEEAPHKKPEFKIEGSRLIVTPESGPPQKALDKAAECTEIDTVFFKEGIYRLNRPIVLDERHSGLRITGDPENPRSAIFDGQGKTGIFVVDGASAEKAIKFSIENLKIINGNTEKPKFEPKLKQDTRGEYTIFAFFDGAGILVIGKTHGNITNVNIENCQAGFCGAGISVQQNYGPESAETEDYLLPVIISECEINNCKAPYTGAAIDILPVSYAIINKCTFKGNQSSSAKDREHGVISVFPKSFAEIFGCQFSLEYPQEIAIDHMFGPGAVKIEECCLIDKKEGQELIREIAQLKTESFLQKIIKKCRDLPRVLPFVIRYYPHIRRGLYCLSSDKERKAHDAIKRRDFS